MTMNTRKGSSYRKRWQSSVNYMSELLAFLERQHPEGVAVQKVAQRLGCTSQHVSQLFIKDDAKLSTVCRIAECYGYELRLFFPVKTYIFGDKPAPHREFPKAGLMAGLANYINDSNMTAHSVSKMAGLSFEVVNLALNRGDIKLSNLYKITDALGISMYWQFDKKEEDHEEKQ